MGSHRTKDDTWGRPPEKKIASKENVPSRHVWGEIIKTRKTKWKLASNRGGGRPFYLAITRSTYSSSNLGKVMLGLASGEAGVTVAKTAMDVELFRRDDGRLPATLAELIPIYLSEVTLDPLTGSPLQYEWSDEMYRIFTDTLNGE